MPEQPQRIGKYEVLSVLGEGGMGIVYRGRDPLIDRTVAIKTILVSASMSEDNLLARLRMEAKSAGRLHHPNIVTVYDYGEEGSLSYLVMEYVDGTNLARIIRDPNALTFSQKLDIVIQLSHGLAYAHDCGVLHRDIKPSNICITGGGVPKILDFGLARIDATRLTRTGQVSGTIAYMSPERLRGETGPGDDIFALGALAYEIFTGQSAFAGKSYSEVAVKIISTEPQAPSTIAPVPAEIDPIVLKAIAKTRAARYTSAADFGRALEEFRTSPAFAAFLEKEPHLTRSAAGDIRPHTGEHPYSAPDLEKPTAEFDPHAATEGELPQSPHTEMEVPPIAAAPADGSAVVSQRRIPTMVQDAPKLPNVPAASGEPVSQRRIPTIAQPAPQPMTQIRFTTDPSMSFSKDGLPTEAAPKTTVAPGRVVDHSPDLFVPTEMQSAPFFSTSARLPISEQVAPTVVAPREARPAQGALVAEAAPAAAVAPKTAIESIARLLPFVVGALTIATIASGATRSIPVVVICYAIAVGAWVLMMYQTRLQSIWWALGIGIVVRLATLMTAPVSAAAPGQGEVSPGGVLLTLGISQSGNSAIVFQLLLLAGELAVIRLLWSKKDPMVAFAYATFPFVVIAGFWDLRIELLAAAMLVGGYTLVKREREGWGGLLTGVAAGTVPVTAGAIPGLVTSAVHDIFMLLVSLLSLFATVKLSPLHTDFASFAEGGVGSPWSFLTGIAKAQVEQGKVGEAVHDWVIPKLKGTTFETLSPNFDPAVLNRTFGIAIVAILTYGLLAFVARRTKDERAAVTNSLGVAVLVFAPFTPAAWLLVAPFALLARSPLWIYYAALSPILLLRSGNTVRDWILNGAALLLPPLIALSTRRTAAAPAKAASPTTA